MLTTPSMEFPNFSVHQSLRKLVEMQTPGAYPKEF